MTTIEQDDLDDNWLPFETVEAATANFFTSGTLANGDTFGDEDDENPEHPTLDGRVDIVAALLATAQARTQAIDDAKKVVMEHDFSTNEIVDGVLVTPLERLASRLEALKPASSGEK